MTEATLATGQQAENLALDYLRKQGLQPLTRNFRSKRGEIDLVMTDRETLVFVEVRYRKNTRFGSGAESVDARKQARLTSTALYFLQRNPKWQVRPARFDVISITASAAGPDIEWIQNAFGV